MTTQARKEIIGKRIRHLRHTLGLTLKELAENTGLKLAQISNWEQGIRTPDLDALEAMSVFFKVPGTWLMGFKEAGDEVVTVAKIGAGEPAVERHMKRQ
ncbi:helix-turn-helix domain-containing protein [Aeromonas aquatica]|uniref:helix-turn-helix domain-containing protein n=1 Tax=Aeromonas aquatica TaxID=558964 RepID=UPI0009DF91C5|nr:helix-turn-helix transcriptional regulator [Aeromonas aquatica]